MERFCITLTGLRALGLAIFVMSTPFAFCVGDGPAYRDASGITNTEYATRTHRAAMALLQAERTAEAVELAIDAAEARSTQESYMVVQTFSTLASVHGDNASNVKGMRWLREEAGAFGNSLRFLRNLAHAEELAGNTDEAMHVRKHIIERFPEEAGYELWQIDRLHFSKSARYSTNSVAGNWRSRAVMLLPAVSGGMFLILAVFLFVRGKPKWTRPA